MDVRVAPWRRLNAKESMLLNWGVGEDSWETCGLPGIQQVTPKANQTWTFTAKTDAEAPIFWPPAAKDWLIGKEPDAGEDWRQEEKGTTEDEMVGWHQWLDGHEPEQARGVGDGQRSLVCCSPWGPNGADTERLNWLTGTVARGGSRIRPLTQKWNHTLVSAALQVPKARTACSSAQRKKVWLLVAQQHWELTFQEQGSQKIMDWHL